MYAGKLLQYSVHINLFTYYSKHHAHLLEEILRSCFHLPSQKPRGRGEIRC